MGVPPPTRVTETSAGCPNCRYNLTGLTEPRCPECGRRLDHAPDEPPGMPLGNVLLMIDVFAVMLAGMVVCISPVPTQGTTIPDSVVVLAMMAPLQFVLMCAAVMAGMHLWRKDGSRLSAALGMGLPVLAGLVSLVAIV